MAKQGGQSGLNNVLRFSKPQSLVDEGFWHRFSTLKLSRLGLDESPIPIAGFYAPCTYTTVSNNLNLRSESLPSDEVGQSSVSSHGDRNKCPVPGTLYNFNTFEGFNAVDRDRLLKEEAKKVLEDIRTGRAVEDPALLSRFFLIAFGDLKRWTFNYLFAFPTPVLNLPAKLVQLKPASQWFTAEEAEYVKAACEEWRKSSLTAGVPFFLVCIASNSQATIRHLKDWEACQVDGQKVLFGFYDPSHIPNIPGWPLRNFLALIHSTWNLESVHFLCYKEPKGRLDLGFSLVGEVLLTVPQGWEDQENVPDASGWELDKNGKYAIRSIGLSRSMEPIRLAKSSGHMNLKLMTWRAWPSLDLAKLYSLKCLLLGAGTLGCQVARSLMAWGIEKITLLDSGKVAMSNPLRQSLYTFNDCLDGGSFKALAAAKNLKEIFPPVEAEGIVMAIPMPGHPMTSQEEESVLEDCKHLHDLIDSHDVVFLLTDTRESRWLPSLLCANSNKITITAALGFDSFLVMRHGPGPFSSTRDLKSEVVNVASTDKANVELNDRGRQRLGCYFCNDVVAPTDSTLNRTLDQQCTVTRPGLAAIASSLAVELLVNILHHPNGIYADGEISNSSGSGSSEQAYGILPHQIRGSLFQFSQMTLVGRASNSCTACCSTVVSEYRRRGKEFLLQAINHPTYLEDLTGLTELMKSASSFTLDWDEDKKDDEDEDDDCIEI